MERVSLFLERLNFYKWIKIYRFCFTNKSPLFEHVDQVFDYVYDTIEAYSFVGQTTISDVKGLPRLYIYDFRTLLRHQDPNYVTKSHLKLLESALLICDFFDYKEYLHEVKKIDYVWEFQDTMGCQEDPRSWLASCKTELLNPPCDCCYYFYFHRILLSQKKTYLPLYCLLIKKQTEKYLKKSFKTMPPLRWDTEDNQLYKDERCYYESWMEEENMYFS